VTEILSNDVCALPPGPIEDIETLREHLQQAIELEHALIPAYLCALYSLDRSENPLASSIVAGVAIEEMFHMALAANVLNAIGGRPEMDIPRMLPGYPRPLPHVDESFQVSLLPFGAEAIGQALQAEHPGGPEADGASRCVASIGQLYARIDSALVRLCAERGEAVIFNGDPSRQVTLGQDARLPAITDLAGARAGLALIVEQGEGGGGTDPEAAHYYRFLELQVGRRFGPGDTPVSGPTGEPIAIRAEAIRPMQPDPQLDDQVVGSPIRAAQEDFNQEYCALLALLDLTFNGEPDRIRETIRAMHGLRAHSVDLMQMEVPGTRYVAGPTFEYVAPADRW
jgi:hypothetical protein